jgi:hypothetical protein
MSCGHQGFHAIRTKYDHQAGVLVYFWTCEDCGERLGEARRESYRPRYERVRGQRSASVLPVMR